MSDSVLVFVREVIWHQAGGYNWNIMPQIQSFLTHVTALLHFYYNFLTLQKNGLRLVHFSLGEAVYKVPVDIGGSHSALCLVTKISKRDRVQKCTTLLPDTQGPARHFFEK